MPESRILLEIGLKLKKERAKKSISQTDLAYSCGIEKANLSRIESGKSNITVRSLHKICTALEISMSDLFKDMHPTI